MFLCDYPSNYYNQSGLEFLKIVPTIWDDIQALNGEVGEYITIAKKSGKDWYIGSMTNSEARTVDIKLDFLDNNKYQMDIYQDAPDPDSNPRNLDIRTINTKKR